jgi:hypothetical protein
MHSASFGRNARPERFSNVTQPGRKPGFFLESRQMRKRGKTLHEGREGATKNT